MESYNDLRGHLRILEEKGLLIRIKQPINKDTELHPLVRLQYSGLPVDKRRAFMFETVTDSLGRKYEIPVLVGGLSAVEEIYAIGLQCSPAEIVAVWDRALSNPIEPQLVTTGPVKEVIHKGESLMQHGGLNEFPVPISTPGFDNAPYFTAACWITKDPETGIRNMGMYRAQIKSPLKTGLCTGPGHNITANWNKANAKQRPLEAAAVIGGSPAIAYAAVQNVPHGVDELAVAGGLINSPIPLVKAETVDLEVPADAEIVIEGIIHTDMLEPEGAFGESHGYIDPRTISPVFEVTAITHRRTPIWVSILSQVTPSESSTIKQRAFETFGLKLLRDHHGLKGVKHVSLYEPLLNRQYAVIKMRKLFDAEPWNAMYALLGTEVQCKIIVAVDDDIDSEDAMSVNWAIVNRSQPHRDLRIVQPRPLPHGPLRFIPPGGYDTFDSSILIDATIKVPFPPVALPARQYMERAIDIWKRLEFPELNMKSPWYGYSMGLWSEESQQEADLAVIGRYFETAEKLKARSVEVPQNTRMVDIRKKARQRGDV